MAVDAEDFKRALRRFASGITVVTVEVDGELHGLTASSFASVSLQPPLVLVCLDKASRTRELLLKKGSFAVNVLATGQEEVSRAFSLKGTKPFDALQHRPGTNGAPLLEGAIAWIECATREVVDGGDHDVVVAEVTACDTNEGTPLVYYDGTYRGLSSE